MFAGPEGFDVTIHGRRPHLNYRLTTHLGLQTIAASRLVTGLAVPARRALANIVLSAATDGPVTVDDANDVQTTIKPQRPQFSGSLARSVHVSPQRVEISVGQAADTLGWVVATIGDDHRRGHGVCLTITLAAAICVTASDAVITKATA